MASEGGGKIRPKKNQTSRKPYERSTSLFGKLKSSVKDLLIPSWLSSIPSAKKTDKDGDKVQTMPHAQDNVPCSAGMEGSGLTASGFQRDRYLQQSDSVTYSCAANVSGKQTHNMMPDFGLPSQNGEVYQELSSLTRLPVGSSQKFSISSDDKKSESAVTELPEQSHHHTTLNIEKGDYETLKLSRVLTKDRGDYEKRTVPLQPVMVSTGAGRQCQNLLADNEKLTLSPDTLRQGRPLIPPSRGKPVFNSLLFGTPSKTDPSSSLNDSFGESLFYAGKTKYGGASATRRKNLNSSLPYQSSLPLRKQVRATRLNHSLNATTSATARRILDTLDHMSGRLEDGKKSTHDGFGNDSVLSFTPSSYRRSMFETSRRPPARPLQLPNRGPSTSQLLNTSRAEISFNRNKLMRLNEEQDSLSVSQEQIEVSYEQDEQVNKMSSVPKTTPSLGNSGKMKTKKFSHHVSKGEDKEICESPLLRTDFKLPVSSLNPINFTTPSSAAFSMAGSKSSDRSYPVFTFSTPVPIQSKCHPSLSPFGSPMSEDFTFSTPVQASSTRTSAAGAEEGSKFSLEPAIGASSVRVWKPCASPKPKTISPDIGGTSSSFECYTKWGSNKKTDNSASFNGAPGFGIPNVATSLKEGSVMDILGGGKNSSSSPNKNDGVAMLSPASISSSVGSATSSTGNTDGESSSAFVPLSALFKKPPGAWDCQTCWIQNAKEALRCVACETPKAPTKPTAPDKKSIIASNSSNVPLSELFKKPVGSWGCDVCMVLNDADNTKCSACETPRKTPKQALPGNQVSSDNSNSNIPLSELFKKPPGSWGCDTCMIRNNSDAMKCVACETPRPVPKQAMPVKKDGSAGSNNSVPLSELFKKPAGSWHCDTCFICNNFDATKCAACETPRPGSKQASVASPKKVDNSLSLMFKRPEGSWVCDTCYVGNTSTALRCVACDSPKPGLQSAGVESATPSSGSAIQFQPGGGFTFNFPTATSSSGTGNFKFGSFGASTKSTTVSSSSCALTAEQEPSQPTGGFTFGNFTSSVSSSSVKFGGTIPETAAASPSEFSNNLQSSSKLNTESSSSDNKEMGNSTGIVQPSPHSSNPVQKSNNLLSSPGGFQFGSLGPTSNTTFPSVNKMSDSTTSAQSNFMSKVTPTNSVIQPPAISKEQKPNVETKAPSLFTFGAPVSLQNSGTTFNFGGSTSTVAPVLNGGFGPVFNKDSEPQKTSNSLAISGITFGGASTPACDTKGSTPSDGFNFMANPVVASHSGFQFSGNSMTGFSFTASSDKNSNPSLNKSSNGSISFKPAPNFNFGSSGSDGATSGVFQFGAPSATGTSASSVFQFGSSAPQLDVPQSSTPAFGASPAMPFGSGNTAPRKMKKAVRRIKKSQ